MLIPAALMLICVAVLHHLGSPPALVLVLSVVGLVPSSVVCVWGTVKFRSYYEVDRTRADLWTMVHATVIQLMALAVWAPLFISALHSYDLLRGVG